MNNEVNPIKHQILTCSGFKVTVKKGCKKTGPPELMNQLLLLLLIPQRTSKDERQNNSTFCWFKSSVRLSSSLFAS